MKAQRKPTDPAQLVATPHGLAARTDHGRVILMQIQGDKVTWLDITPQWNEDGTLKNWSPVAQL